MGRWIGCLLAVPLWATTPTLLPGLFHQHELWSSFAYRSVDFLKSMPTRYYQTHLACVSSAQVSNLTVLQSTLCLLSISRLVSLGWDLLRFSTSWSHTPLSVYSALAGFSIGISSAQVCCPRIPHSTPCLLGTDRSIQLAWVLLRRLVSRSRTPCLLAMGSA